MSQISEITLPLYFNEFVLLNRMVLELKKIDKTKHCEDILDKIHPKAAIISHDNGCFGGATDFHPNEETLFFLKQRNIKIYLTNNANLSSQQSSNQQQSSESSTIKPVFKKNNPPNNSFVEID